MFREFAVDLSCDESVKAARRALSTLGLRVEQSFDLRAALALVPDCTCPHHGTDLCDCQYNVLLVYQRAVSPPVTLVVHGHDNRSWITVSHPPDGRVPTALSFEVVRALALAGLITLDSDSDVSSSVSAPH